MSEMALPIKPHTRTPERQWATPFSTEYHDGGQTPEVLVTLLLQNIETSFQRQNGATKLDVRTRHRLTAGDTTVC